VEGEKGQQKKGRGKGWREGRDWADQTLIRVYGRHLHGGELLTKQTKSIVDHRWGERGRGRGGIENVAFRAGNNGARIRNLCTESSRNLASDLNLTRRMLSTILEYTSEHQDELHSHCTYPRTNSMINSRKRPPWTIYGGRPRGGLPP
jgi:hypothetical protein